MLKVTLNVVPYGFCLHFVGNMLTALGVARRPCIRILTRLNGRVFKAVIGLELVNST